MYRLSTEVFHQNRRWRYAVIEVGSLGQTLERVLCRACRNSKEARREAKEALEYERSKRNAS